MFKNLSRPTIFAHRGASSYAPENTLAAFELAVQQHADAIELDAKLCEDGKVVVIHDQTVDRTTNGAGKVRDLPLGALKELDAGSFFDIEFQSERIPTLEEVFEAVGRKIYINVELTNYASPTDSLPEKVAALVKQHGLEQRVMFSSFNPLALIRGRKLLPAVPVGLLALPDRAGAWARGWPGYFIPYQALHPELQDTTQSLVKTMHQRGKRVHVWTVNQAQDMAHLLQINVDGIFTDNPLLAASERQKFNPPQEL